MLKSGTPVRIKGSVHDGTVKRAILNEEGTEMQYLVEYEDQDGVTQERYFLEAQFVVKEAAK